MLQLHNNSIVTKKDIENAKDNIIKELNDGTINPIQLAISFKAVEKLNESIKKELNDRCIDEALRHSNKTFNAYGSTIEYSENIGVRYDFSQCGHTEWEILDQEIAELTKRKKNIEKFLLSLPSSTTIVCEMTGEIDTIYPPQKKSSSGIKITLDK